MPTLPAGGPDLGLLLALVLPLFAIQLALMFVALRDLTRPERRVRGGNKWLWAAVIVFGELIGPLVYFFVGREEG
jgi:hypothetical protein